VNSHSVRFSHDAWVGVDTSIPLAVPQVLTSGLPLAVVVADDLALPCREAVADLRAEVEGTPPVPAIAEPVEYRPGVEIERGDLDGG
jgi:hypothetical protein